MLLTWGLCCYSAVAKLCFQRRHDDSTGANAICCRSARSLQKGPTIAPQSTQSVCGIWAAQGGVRVWRIIDSDITDDIRPCLQARAEEKKMQTVITALLSDVPSLVCSSLLTMMTVTKHSSWRLSISLHQALLSHTVTSWGINPAQYYLIPIVDKEIKT